MKLAILFTVNCLLLLISHTRGNFVSAFNLAENAQNRELKIDLYEIAPNKTVYVIDKLNKFSFENDQFIEKIDENDLKKIFSHHDERQIDPDFRFLFSNEDYLLIGSKNRLLNYSLSQLSPREDKIKISVDWNSESKSEIECKGQNPKTCNIISTAIPLNRDFFNNQSNTLLMCGYAINQAVCRSYSTFISNDSTNIDFKPTGKLFRMPYLYQSNFLSPTQNIPPFAYANSFYFFHSYAQVQDIYKQNYANANGELQLGDVIKTPLGAIKNPNFRSSFGYKDKMYFFYSESEVSDFNNGVSFKTPNSMIGQICANDNGRLSFTEPNRRFITFKKIVVNCYLPEYKQMIHVKYSEMQEATKPIQMKLEDGTSVDVIYAIFTLRRANNFDSALCMFKLNTIEDAMKGFFKNNPEKTEPSKPLSSCESYKYMDNVEIDKYYKDVIKYGKFQLEQSINEKALFALNNVKFTSIEVDQSTNVLFVGLSDGRVLKLVIEKTQAIIADEYTLFNKNTQVDKLIVSSGLVNKFVAITNGLIKIVPLDLSCGTHRSCHACLHSQDPYCSWSKFDFKCVYAPLPQPNGDLLHGNLNQCKSEDVDEDASTYGAFKSDNAFKNSLLNESTKNNQLIMAIILSALFSSLFSIVLTLLFIRNKAAFMNLRHETSVKLPFIHSFLNRKNPTDDEDEIENLKTESARKSFNFYEKTKIRKSGELQPVSVLCSRQNVESPTTTSSSLIESNHNSPNAYKNESTCTNKTQFSCSTDTNSSCDDNSIDQHSMNKMSEHILQKKRTCDPSPRDECLHVNLLINGAANNH